MHYPVSELANSAMLEAWAVILCLWLAQLDSDISHKAFAERTGNFWCFHHKGQGQTGKTRDIQRFRRLVRQNQLKQFTNKNKSKRKQIQRSFCCFSTTSRNVSFQYYRIIMVPLLKWKGRISASWALCNIITKKQSLNISINYSPISNLPITSKNIGKTVFQQQQNYFLLSTG